MSATLLTGMLVAALFGCSNGTAPQPSGSPGSPGAQVPSMKEPASKPADPQKPQGTAMPTDPENPQDLRGAPIVVSGVVHVDGGCVALDTGTVTWLLGGPTAATLADGVRVTVTGRPMPVPAGCHADRALTVQRAG